MAPKVDISDPAVAALKARFEGLGLAASKADDVLRSPANSASFTSLLDDKDLGLEDRGKLDPKVLNLVLSATTASTNPPLGTRARAYIVKRVLDGSLASADQVTTASKFLSSTNPSGEPTDVAAFDKATGVGVVVTPDEIRKAVAGYIDAHKAEFDEASGWGKHGALLGSLRTVPELRWAPALDVKTTAEKLLEERYGPKSAYKPPAKEKSKPKKESAAANTATAAAASDARPEAMFEEGFLSKLHKPGENPQTKPELKAAHLAATGGRVLTRFPPEPNGFLHIGHAKAIAIDFGFAQYHQGLTYLRYDDTNPAAEEEQYFASILEMVRWLGFEPWKITYSSDYFDRLYECALELIRRGKAYVDHSTAEEIKAGRGVVDGQEGGPRKANKWSSRPIEENLAEFQAMRDGKYKPGEAVLRMKQDLEGSGNPQMWDLIAYRVLDVPHHRTGDAWRIYPTYDFTHCLVDSFENISHSLCTTEFILSRESYEWLCDAIDVYKPRQYEFGRLSLEGTITSKRKLLRLVKAGHVQDWDDPRLYTLIALRRRGIPPGAILSFVSQLGVTTAVSQVQGPRLDQAVRSYLETTTPRLMMILKPLKLVLTNLPADFRLEIEKPYHPKDPAMGSHVGSFTRECWIDASDFRAEDDPDYFRLAPGKTVGLLHIPHAVTCVDFSVDESGQPAEVRCVYEDGSARADGSVRKAKTYIQWVAQDPERSDPITLDEVRVFHPLFGPEVPNPGGEKYFESLVRKDSMEVIKGALIEKAFLDLVVKCVDQAANEARERKESLQKARSEAARDARKAAKLAGPEEGISPVSPTSPVDSTPVAAAKATTSAPATVPDEEDPAHATRDRIGKEVVRFQATRIAYFALDRESVLRVFDTAVAHARDADSKDAEAPALADGDRIVLNRIVSLKEDREKESAAAKGGAKGKGGGKK